MQQTDAIMGEERKEKYLKVNSIKIAENYSAEKNISENQKLISSLFEVFRELQLHGECIMRIRIFHIVCAVIITCSIQYGLHNIAGCSGYNSDR